jgi:hypothetical protein
MEGDWKLVIDRGLFRFDYFRVLDEEVNGLADGY